MLKSSSRARKTPSLMMYKLDTNNHVKVWLGPLTLKNELRLKNLRTLNPQAKLVLVYDRRLLSKSQYTVLQNVCNKLSIRLFDMVNDIVPKLTSPLECDLFGDYEQAIQSFEEGGNMAAASDILRFLSPVYRLGIYSDLDVLIETKGLAESVKVERPILFNLGSLKIFDADYPTVNNDLFAVVDEKAARTQIENLQRAIHLGCSRPNATEDVFSMVHQQALDKPYHPDTWSVSRYLTSLPTAFMNDWLKELATAKSASEVRKELIKQMADSDSFYQYYPKLWWLYKLMSLGSKQRFDDTIKALRDKMLLDSVVYTSGPATTLLTNYDYLNYPTKLFDKELAPASFEYYGLDKYFQSGNRMPLHTGYFKALSIMQTGGNDLSWLDSGQQRIKTHEKDLENIGTDISSTDTALVTKPMIAEAELEQLATGHMQQLAELQHQSSMNRACDVDRTVTFTDCSEVNGTKACVETTVKLKTPLFFSTGDSFPKSLDYDCNSKASTTPTVECKTNVEVQLCDKDFYTSDSYLSPMTQRLGSVAGKSMLASAIPEAIKDFLFITMNVRYSYANLAKDLGDLLFVLLSGSWLSTTVASLTTIGAERFLKVSNDTARVIGFAAALAANATQNGVTAETLLTLGVSLGAGQFGLWAENKFANYLSSLKVNSEFSQAAFKFKQA